MAIGWFERLRASSPRPLLSIIVAVVLIGLAGGLARSAAAQVVSDVQVVGTQRIDPDTVRSYMLVNPGDSFDAERLDRSLKALFATGLFADVTIRREGGTVVVTVVENPVINRVAFEGNQRVDNETLNAEVQLRPRLVFTRTRVQQDVQRIVNVYRRTGRFAAQVEPKVIQLEQNRVDLVFEIDEGPLTTIRAISFIGNERYSDSTLRDVIQTKEYAFWRLLTTTDTYDPDRLSFDRELLRRFYLGNGYADFRVVSAVAELTPDRESFVVTFTIEEGDRYRFGPIDVDVKLKRVEPDQLREVLTTIEGERYDADEVETTIDNLTDTLGTLGFAFIDIRPSVDRDREARTVSITYQIGEGPRVFVERIDIEGNVRTLDRVVRREFELVEGDAFNTSKLRRSQRRIRNLGFFKGVEVTNVEGSAEDRTVIKVEVEEQPTGEISFGVGFSSLDGPLADVGIRERNLLGRGQDLRFRFSGAASRQEFDLGFTEPYFLDRRLSAGVDLFRITRDLQDDSSYDEERTGAGIRFGYDLGEDLSQSVGYQIKKTEISNVDADASRVIREQEGSTTVSQISQTLTYDRRDNRIDPREGYFASVTNDLAGFGGDVAFLRTRLKGGYYYPLSDDYTLALLGESGYIFGIGDDIGIAERFFVGGRIFRGFSRSGIGPRDVTTDDALGGNKYYVGTVELSFPLGLPDDLGLKAFVFTDAGSLWDVDDSGSEIADSSAIRASMGTGLAWATAFGLIRVDVAQAILKEDEDETEIFRFSFGTRF